MGNALLLLVTLITIVWISASSTSPTGRMLNGVPVDTLKRFPHHVNIEVTLDSYDANGYRTCSGSIIDEDWILTSISCTKNARSIQLDFWKQYANNSENSFSLIVGPSAVHVYPTEYDDLALIHLPTRLQLNSLLRSVRLPTGVENLQGRLAVLPGFHQSSEQLEYGMFELAANSVCKVNHSTYDEFLNLCTVGWRKNGQVPCEGNQGAGLLLGWPVNPILVGVFSYPEDCSSSKPAVYTKVSQYVPWILSVTSSDKLSY